MTEPTPEPRSEAWAATADEPDTELSDEAIEAAADDEAPTDMRGVRKLRNEAARLRHLLREEQANRASDLARLAAYEKAEVERAAGTVLVDPEDLWRHTDEATQAEFNDEFGSVIGDRVKEAAQAIAASRPHLAKPNIAPPPSKQPIEGRSGASPELKKPTTPTWAQALHGR
jgi:hypothetical protein